MNENTDKHLKRIAEHLISGQASLFVGAGFSKNAKLQDGAKRPPDWEELGDLFIAKTRGHKPESADRSFANILRLAEEVETLCGRHELTAMIKDAINNENLSPSEAHYKLMALPWNDVYTTNYDTLLERSADRLESEGRRSYTIITNSEDIGTGSSPLLVKLHGNLDDESSIIITEEDYRSYPARHQAMIGNIQNAIMRGNLVMIGFSGNDPNFLQWLGWVRDALHGKMRKVYLLSLDSLSEASRRTFEKKNVEVVDIRHFAGKDSSVVQDVDAVVDFLVDCWDSCKKEVSEYRAEVIGWGKAEHRGLDADSLCECWKKERDTYPGWLVLPRDKREYLTNSEGFSLSADVLSGLQRGRDLLFLDLFNWRIEKCLYPIQNDWEQIYLQVLENNKPVSGRFQPGILAPWINLKLGLLRLYRQEGWREKWLALRDELVSLQKMMEDGQRCRFEYEQALESVYINDFVTLQEVLEHWAESKVDYYWDVRRGALWAEYLSLEKGREIVRMAFDRIAGKFDASEDERERYYWASRKVHAHTVLECMSKADFSNDDCMMQSVQQTWLDLRSYEDIWYEREFFQTNLRFADDVLKVTTTTASFRLGYTSTTTNIGGNSKDYRVAYAYFLYYEEMGFPIHLPYLITVDKTSMQKALSVMEYCSPSISECWMLRSGDSKTVKFVYNRGFLERTSFQTVDSLYTRYLGCLDLLIKAETSETLPTWTLAYRAVIPEILSRLCMKASYGSRLKTLDLINEVFRSGYYIRYVSMDNLVHSLMASFTDEEVAGLIPMLALMNIAPDRFGDYRVEPMSYVNRQISLKTSVIDIVDRLMGEYGESPNRDKVIVYRLIFLYECGALSEKQKTQLADILWSKRDASGFPESSVFNRYAFLTFPHPDDVNPEELLKEYLRTQALPVVGKGKTFFMFGGKAPVFNELKGTTNPDAHFKWDSSLLNDVCAKIIGMWDADKEHLLDAERPGALFPVQGELRGRFDDVETVISTIFVPHFNMLSFENKSGLIRLSAEYEKYSMPSLRMRTALSGFLGETFDFDHSFRERICSTDERAINDSIRAVKFLHKKGSDVSDYVKLMSEYFRCNSDPGRIAIINGIGYFLDKSLVIDDEIKDNLILGLDRLFSFTEISVTDDERAVNQKMNLRMSVASIVKNLSAYPILEDDGVLDKWRQYFHSDETCLDIRNQY